MNKLETHVLVSDRDQREGSWHALGLEKRLSVAGDYVTGEIGDEPVVVIRNVDNQLLALSRVCRHRGFDMLAGEGREGSKLKGSCGNVKRMSCPYHAWTYDLDGKLAAAPVSDQMCDFDKDSVALPRFAIEIRQGVIFVHLGEQPNDLDEQLREEPIDFTELSTTLSQRYS